MFPLVCLSIWTCPCINLFVHLPLHLCVLLSMSSIQLYSRCYSICQSVCPSLSLLFRSSVCHSPRMSFCLSVHPSVIRPCIRLSIHPSVRLTFLPYVRSSIQPSISLSIWSSLLLFVHPSDCPSFPQSTHISICRNFRFKRNLAAESL